MIGVYLNDKADEILEEHSNQGFLFTKPINNVSVSFEITNDEIGMRSWRVNFDPVLGKFTIFELTGENDYKVEFTLP